MSVPMPAGDILLDRREEREELDRLADAARRGESGSLVLFGDAGMGKTALLDYAASTSGLRVVQISGIETEQEFGFAALHRLLRPFLRGISQLQAPQRMALQVAFGEREEGSPDRFMVGLAALSLLAAESAKEPILCLVDDAQWIDAESMATLAFVGRRISAEGIVLLFAVRTAFDVPLELVGIRSMEINGLPAQEAGDLLREAAGRELGSDVISRIVTEMNGCPLALKELGKELAETYVADRRSPLEPVTIRHRLEDHFSRQIADLPPDSRLLLLIAAADTSGDRALVSMVARQFGCGIDAQLIAEQRRLVLPGHDMKFRHPLIRSTVYAGADPEQRRAVHRALANAMGSEAFPDRWARHVALGAAGPDEKLAGQLEAMSQMAQARGGFWAQASLLAQAADLSESVETRALRLVSAAGAAFTAGAHEYVAKLLDQAEPYVSDPVALAEVTYLRGRLAMAIAQPTKAPALLLAAARAFLPLDAPRAREVLLETFSAYSLSGKSTEGASPSEIAALAAQTQSLADPPTLQDHLLDGLTDYYRADRAGAYRHFRMAADLIRAGSVPDDQMANWVQILPAALTEVLDDTTYNLWVKRADAYARANGALLLLLFNLFAKMHADVRAGNLRGAARRNAEALDIVAAVGLSADVFGLYENIIDCWRGDDERGQASTANTIKYFSAMGGDHVVVMAYWARAVLHIGTGRYEEALADTDFIRSQDNLGFIPEALPVAVEAAVRVGQIAKAREALGDLEMRATSSGSAWALGLLARSSALLADSSRAEDLYLDALNLLSQTSITTEVAHTRLLYGEWLRRERRRLEAREQLRLAHDYFSEIGAFGFARRAHAELLATGERARPRTIEHAADLTVQEQRIAELASDGFSNREIASQLFISATTVEYHLGKVYRKLGINSRGRLKRALGGGDAERI